MGIDRLQTLNNHYVKTNINSISTYALESYGLTGVIVLDGCVKIPLSCFIVLSFFLFKLKKYGYLVDLAHLLYSCLLCLSFHISL